MRASILQITKCFSALSLCAGSSLLIFCQDQPLARQLLQSSGKGPVTVADAIRMTRLAESRYELGSPSKGLVAHFSPDGSKFVVVLKKGDLEKNTNVYSMLLWRTSSLRGSPHAKLLLTMSTSSNREAIKSPMWLDDNDTILFLGEHPGERMQLYSVRCSSGVIKRITNHSTNLISFTATEHGDKFVFMAAAHSLDYVTKQTLREGFDVRHEFLSDLIRGFESPNTTQKQLFATDPVTGREKELHVEGELELDTGFWLSPNGNHVIVQADAANIPPLWIEYEDKFLHLLLSQKRLAGGVQSGIFVYELVDTRTGQSRTLLDTPIPSGGSELAWSPDSKSAVVSNVYLPLDSTDPQERAIRRAHTFLIEISVPDGTPHVISDKDLRLLAWDKNLGGVECELGRLDSLIGKPVSTTYFQRAGHTWSEIVQRGTTVTNQPEIVLDENMNQPPRIIAIYPADGRKLMLLDLNPQFKQLLLAKVEEVRWKSTAGDDFKGGLYWPINYVAGKRYPLVIQTHGFTPDKFWIGGPWTTAFAAQPLASKGFFVLQVQDEVANYFDSPAEAPRVMAAYEGAIDYLEERGLVDANRVGIIGFSRTCFYVTYSLTHSARRFAAAVIADGFDAGYFPYLAFANSLPLMVTEVHSIIGDPPFGAGLSSWIKSSPGFLVDRVRTPLRIQSLGPLSLLTNWDWFAAMFQSNKPVDLIYLPDGTHILEKPWERMVSQQGDVDWFTFWLQGEEDSDPAKRYQYMRWRELRTQQKQLEDSGVQ
jgi:dipeptidyl aminopeptidase/acylaminoacyl peptidase